MAAALMPVKTFSRKMERLSTSSLTSLPSLVGAEENVPMTHNVAPPPPAPPRAPETKALEAFSYRELQALAKEHGVAANQKADALRAALTDKLAGNAVAVQAAGKPLANSKKKTGLSQRAANSADPAPVKKEPEIEAPAEAEAVAAEPVAAEPVAAQPSDDARRARPKRSSTRSSTESQASVGEPAKTTRKTRVKKHEEAATAPPAVPAQQAPTTAEPHQPAVAAVALEQEENKAANPERTMSAKKRRVGRTLEAVKKCEAAVDEQARLLAAIGEIRAKRAALMATLFD